MGFFGGEGVEGRGNLTQDFLGAKHTLKLLEGHLAKG
jgi:hypothetical protein